MSAPAPIYLKVSSGGLSWKGRGGLWVAEDHLLEVSSALIFEYYRRFFFHDVRAFVVQRTLVRLIWNWVLGGVGAVFALVAGTAVYFGKVYSAEDWNITLYMLAGIFGFAALILLILLIFNLALGPSCRCHLLTSTGWHTLSAPKRLGRATDVQARLGVLIQNAQGAVPVPEVPAP